MKLRKGDTVKVMIGKDKGKEAKIDRVFLASNRVVLLGINLYKKHVKPRGEGQKGSISEVARPMVVSKLALVCPKCKEVTRVGFKFLGDKKVRICRKCEQEV